MKEILEILKMIVSAMELFGHKAFTALSSGCSTVFATLFACSLIWMIVWKGGIQGELDARDFLKKMLLYLGITALLQLNFYLEWLCNPLSNLTADVINAIIGTISNTGTDGGKDMYGVVQGIYNALDGIMMMLTLLMKEGGFMSFMNPVAIWFLEIPFVFIYTVSIIYYLRYLYILMVITGLSPVLIVMSAFAQTRSTVRGAFTLLMHGTLSFAVSVLGMGLTVHFVRYISEKFNASDQVAGSFAFSSQYWGCFVLANLCLFLQLISSWIANISGFSGGPGAAAFVPGLVTTALVAAKGAGMRGMARAGERMTVSGRAMGRQIYNRIRGEE